MDELGKIYVKIGELEGERIALNNRLRAIPKKMAKDFKTNYERVEAAHYLYWFTDIPTEDIAAGLLGMKSKGSHITNFLKQIGGNTIDIACERCKQPIKCRSRQQLKDISDKLRRSNRLETKFPGHAEDFAKKYGVRYDVICDSCWSEIQQEMAKKFLSENNG